MPYITHSYGRHVCFKIYFRSTLFSAHGNLFWQNSEWMPVVRAPLKRGAGRLKGNHSSVRAHSSAGDDGASGANAGGGKPASHSWPGTGSHFWEKKQHLTTASSGDGEQDRCWCRNVTTLLRSSSCGSQGSAVCSLPQRQQKSFSDTGAKYTPVGTAFPWEIAMFFLEPRSSGSFLPKFTSKAIRGDPREGERCRLPDCVGR